MTSSVKQLILVSATVTVLSIAPLSAQANYDTTNVHGSGHNVPMHTNSPSFQVTISKFSVANDSIQDCEPAELRATDAALARAASEGSRSPLDFHIVDSDGSPIAEAEVLVAQWRRPWRCLAFSSSDQGIVSLDLRRPKRRHELLISAPGYEERWMTWNPPLAPAEQHRIQLASKSSETGTALNGAR